MAVVAPYHSLCCPLKVGPVDFSASDKTPLSRAVFPQHLHAIHLTEEYDLQEATESTNLVRLHQHEFLLSRCDRG
ncbi:hypothetical protein KCU90_g101, partial [Aureobasidium melanogenum]